MKKEKYISNRISIQFVFIMILFLIIVVLSVMIINLGKEIYVKINADRTNNFETRVSLSYITNKIRQADKENTILVKELNGNSAIVIKETYDGLNYENWIYYNDNNICEIFIDEGLKFNLSDGMKITKIDNFNVTKIKDNLYELSVRNKNQTVKQVLSLYSSQWKKYY